MAWYRCMIRGENFPAALAGRSQGLVGFYTTRFVEAKDEVKAEIQAVDSLRGEPKLTPPPGYVPDGRAQVFLEEIEQVAASSVPADPAGLIWYPMDD